MTADRFADAIVRMTARHWADIGLVAVDLSAHLAAADKRARDASAEVLRLHGELNKARKALAEERRDVCAFLIESARQRQVSDWDSGAIERGEHVGAFARRKAST